MVLRIQYAFPARTFLFLTAQHLAGKGKILLVPHLAQKFRIGGNQFDAQVILQDRNRRFGQQAVQGREKLRLAYNDKAGLQRDRGEPLVPVNRRNIVAGENVGRHFMVVVFRIAEILQLP